MTVTQAMITSTQRVRRGQVALAVTRFDPPGGGHRPQPARVVFVHGLAGHAGEWLPLASRGAGGWALDQRGHGESTRHPPTVSPEAYADDLAAVIEAVARSRPVCLVGHAMGALTALLVATRRPELVESLLLLEASPNSLDRAGVEQLRAALTGWPVPFPTHDHAVGFFGDTPSGRARADGLVRTPEGWHPAFALNVILDTARQLARRDWWPDWATLSCPITVLAAEHGTLRPGELHAMATMPTRGPRPTIRVVPHAGHHLHLDAPDTVRHTLHTLTIPLNR